MSLPGLENIPLIKDTVPGFVAVGWFAVLGPKGMPNDLAARINKDMNQALSQPELVAKMRDISLFHTSRTQTEARDFLKADVERWAAVIKKVGIVAQ
jgi:tripartite-type tricarboxylate transporter receptor subunit TctC